MITKEEIVEIINECITVKREDFDEINTVVDGDNICTIKTPIKVNVLCGAEEAADIILRKIVAPV